MPPLRVPTLTEVIEVSEPTEAVEIAAVPEPAQVIVSTPAVEAVAEPAPASPTAPPGEVELTARVLADVLRQVDTMLEHRLREALMPALLEASDQIVLQARTELATALNDVVSRAVTQEIARLRMP